MSGLTDGRLGEDMERQLLNIFMASGCLCHTKRHSSVNAEPPIRHERDDDDGFEAAPPRKMNMLERAYLDRGIS